jgi:autotransporter strand-loop-strand O-heptosyltransferase
MNIYDNLIKNNEVIQKLDPRFVINFINGPYLEVTNAVRNNFDVSFIDKKTGTVHYSTNIGNGSWTRSNISYFMDWKIIAKRDDGEIFEFEFDAKDKRVFIALESKSIGDTLAWFPYIDEFRKKWDCEVICSTFWNNLFREKYPNLEFVEPGSVVNGIYAMYKIGWFYDENGNANYILNPSDFKTKSLQQTASDILGLDFKHVKANIVNFKKKRVGIGFHSTAQTKYWNNPTGWQEVVDYLNSKDYEVIILSKEEDGYMGNYYPTGATKLPEGSMEALIEVMSSCDFFIGIGSGLSWLSWSLNVPTVLISGFSTPVSEFEGDDVIRIFNDSVCNGCYNRYKFNPGDWNWCPDHKGTEKQFECTKSITGEMVIKSIEDKGWIK